ncbi:hypothetical protein A1D26_00025 [Ursidibacter maritimus]|nr:hypothetical protein A1D26_00025 [Ursidibacter maritimus]
MHKDILKLLVPATSSTLSHFLKDILVAFLLFSVSFTIISLIVFLNVNAINSNYYEMTYPLIRVSIIISLLGYVLWFLIKLRKLLK